MSTPDEFTQAAYAAVKKADEAVPERAPLADEPSQAADAAQATRRQLLIIGVLAFNLLASVAIAAADEVPDLQVWFGFVYGVCFAQVGLSACSLVLATGSRALRITIAGLILGNVCLSFGILAFRMDGLAVGYVFGGLFIGNWLMLLVPLALMRWTWSWRIMHVDRPNTLSGREWQFNLRQLLSWTAAIAVLLGIGRWAMPNEELAEQVADFGLEIAVVIGVLIGFNVAVAIPTIFAAFAPRRSFVWLLLAFLASLVVSVAEEMLLNRVSGGAENGIVFFINGLHVCWLGGCLLAIRGSGFRLVKMGK